MTEKKFLITVLIASGVLLFGGITMFSKNSETDKNEEQVLSVNSKAITEETSFAWGNIGLNDGNVEKIFEIKNEGEEELLLSEVVTSCMCTTAQLSLNGEDSPVFGMHSKSDYKLSVPAGQIAQLKVVFDPAFHGPSGVGPINRQITVKTNDQSRPQLNFTLTAMVRR